MKQIQLVIRTVNYLFVLAFFLMSLTMYSQKTYNFGISFGSEQLRSKNIGFSPNSYILKDNNTSKIGVFIEKKTNEKTSILIGLNYNSYWNDFDYINGNQMWYQGFKNTYYDLDLQLNRYFSKNFKYFIGTGIIYHRFHNKYSALGTNLDGSIYNRIINDATDFNFILNSGIKYEINPKSKLIIEPFIMVGSTLIKRDNYKSTYYDPISNSSSFYKNLYTRFGLNIKI